MINAIKMASDLRQMHLAASITSQLVLQIIHNTVLVFRTVNFSLLWLLRRFAFGDPAVGAGTASL